jgi:hypothetical protein
MALKMILAILHASATAVIVFALAYLLGHDMLSGGLQGSDTPLHVGYAVWLDQYFPRIPHWYPLQGGGGSILHGYPLLAHFIAVILHRMIGLSILQAVRLMGFAAFPLTALGVYAFCGSVLKRQSIGLLAAVFFLLAPVTWTWMYNWGFFAQQVAVIFLPLTLIAFDRTLHHQLARRLSGRGRLWFVTLIILLAVSSLSHMMVGAAEVVGVLLLTAFSAIIARPGDRRRIMRGGLKITLLLGLIAGILLAAYVVPFYAYGRVAGRQGVNTPALDQVHRLPIPEFFGLKAIDPLQILTRMQFPLIVTGFALIGVILALALGRRSGPEGEKARALSLCLIAATVFTLSPALAAIVLRMAPFLFQFINFRSVLVLTTVFMPVIAAYGVWTLAFYLIQPRLLLGQRKRADDGERASHTTPASALASVLSLLIVGAIIIPTGALATKEENTLSYGPAMIDLSDLWRRREPGTQSSLLGQLRVENWPALELADTDSHISLAMDLASLLPTARPLRIDISPYHGRIAMDLTTYGDLSQINAYTYTTSLVHAMWGYQQNVFFSIEPPATESGNERTLNNLSQWFGTQYVFLNPVYDASEMYRLAGWELVHEEGNLQVWRDPGAPPMATATTRPAILVVGQPETDAYMTVFRLANDGMLPYADALLVEGQPRVDRYTPEELRAFDAVFLYGYDYRDGTEAWDVLASYVEQGGNLYVDTGWEFWIPEWEFERAPQVLPVDRLVWTDYGPVTQYEMGAPEIAGEIDVAKFRPLIWEGQPWTLSGAEATDVRDWGRVVLAAGGRPLIVAGEYGEGKVVWSGMNLIGHARYGETNAEEVRLLGNLIRWLTAGSREFDGPAPVIRRDDPDHLSISLAATPGQVTWLYWREAFYPDWHAYLVGDNGGEEIPIYRGGPGFMLMPIESETEAATVQLRWEPSVMERLAVGISAIGILLVMGLLLDGLLLQGNGFTWLKIALIMRTPRPFLGEGSNREWAEQKRAELEAGHLSPDTPLHLMSSQAISWWMGDSRGKQAGRLDRDVGSKTDLVPRQHRADSDSSQAAISASIEAPSDDAERGLLESWLNGTGHAEDAWAEKLLGRMGAAQGVGSDSETGGGISSGAE